MCGLLFPLSQPLTTWLGNRLSFWFCLFRFWRCCSRRGKTTIPWYDTLMISSGIHIHTSSEDVIKNGPSCIESSHLWKPLSCAFFYQVVNNSQRNLLDAGFIMRSWIIKIRNYTVLRNNNHLHELNTHVSVVISHCTIYRNIVYNISVVPN